MRIFRFCLGILALCFFSSWGFFVHKLINQSAVFTLPSELAGFFKVHIATITAKAIDADKRCYADTAESVRHYIDLDRYDDAPDSIPVHWSKAKEKYQERTIIARGIIPWQIEKTYRKLVSAFEKKEINAIIRHAADLGHYVADAHVPLHTTRNYNGQYSKQIGIHAFWETRLPEMFSSKYDLLVGRAKYIEDPLSTAWEIVKESHGLVDSVLSVEKNLSKSIPAHLQKAYLSRNKVMSLQFSDHYAHAYHDALNDMVQRRLRSSIHMVGSFWFSAWVDAGQPSLRNIDPTSTYTIQDTLPTPTNKIFGREEWH
ncbi:zinc dependent phospholipase C family protein [Sphingobacterium corticis]|uniref:Zinc dependent phospholipase C family protein n=1 Tax=Sphingobacterium corticis TaxID=1812823 RepID=A0ABW5NM86_9SPHI